MPRPFVLAACFAAAFTGCGDDGDGPKGVTTVEGGEVVRVVGDEYEFEPSRVVVAGAGGQVRLRLDNRGVLAHNLRIFRGERDLGGTPTFQGGQARSGSVSLRPGSYRMICTVGDHAELGMTGSLRVRARN